MTDEKKPTMAIKDSGKRQNFNTGSRRDTNTGKVRPDLIPPTCLFLKGAHYGFGSMKYGDRNWEKGQPIMRFWESYFRHSLLFSLGDISEPHLSGAIWNAEAIQHTLLMIKHGQLPIELDDRPFYMLPGNPIGKELIEEFNRDAKTMLERQKELEDSIKG